jgi:two-component system sensor histidine kinase BaeS
LGNIKQRWIVLRPLRSITLKLSLGFLVVGVLGVVLSALVIRLGTQRAFDRFLGERARSDFIDTLPVYYQTHGGWDGLAQTLDASLGPPSVTHLPPITIIDSNREVIYSQDNYPIGQLLPQHDRSWEIPIRVNNETVGWVYIQPTRPPLQVSPQPASTVLGAPQQGSPEQGFISGVTMSTLYSGLIAAVVAIIVGFFLARSLTRPIRELTTATQALAEGKLDHRVAVHSQDELGELAMSFNRMSADLARANDLRRQMTADIAHDLRTPLSVILGYTEALSENKLPGSPQAFDAIHTEALHLQRLIEALRTLSLADAGELPLMRLPIKAPAILNRVVAAYAPQAQQRHITIEAPAPSGDSPEIVVDVDRMAQVLSNLVSNALRYTPEGGRIVLTAEPHGKGTRLVVRDDGGGIDPEDLPYIFERFYRGDKSRQLPQGDESGLGLAIARSIVEAHGGTISVESTLGEGTTFIIDIEG